MLRNASPNEANLNRLAGALKSAILLLVVFVSASLLTDGLRAQSFYGTLVGTVTDASGAVVHDATVKVINTGTNEVHEAKSDAAGKFSVVNLVPADYRIEFSKSAFKTYIREHVPVQVGQTVRIDGALAVGNATETVEV